jgi:hypothetical protein
VTVKSYALIAILLGIGGFVYCGNQLSGLQPVDEMAGIMKALETEYGRWQTGQYVSAFVAFCGFMALIMKR